MLLRAACVFFVGAGCGAREITVGPSLPDAGGTDAGAAPEGRDAATPDGGVADAGVEDAGWPAVPDAGGGWLAGDLHVHATGASHDTDDSSYPADIKRVAIERGLQFIVLTDHSDATGCPPGQIAPECMNVGPEFPYWDEAARLTEPGVFVMVDGNEISPVQAEKKGDPGYPPGEPRGHLGCIPDDLAAFTGTAPGFAFVDRPVGVVTGGQNVKVCHDIGGLVVVHHPYNVAVWTEYDWTSTDYDGLEIWNGGLRFDDGDVGGMKAWLCDWSKGKKTVPTGASDCHRVSTPLESDSLTDTALGQARTSVYAREFSWSGIAEGFKAGRVVVHDFDNMIELWAFDEAGRYLGMPGDTIEVARGANVVFTVRGHQRKGASVLLSSVKPGSCNDTRRPGSVQPPKIDIVDLFSNGDHLGARRPFDYAYAVTVPFDEDTIVFARTWRTLDSSLNNDLAVTNAILVKTR